MDLQQACTEQYGSGSIVELGSNVDPFSWYCQPGAGLDLNAYCRSAYGGVPWQIGDANAILLSSTNAFSSAPGATWQGSSAPWQFLPRPGSTDEHEARVAALRNTWNWTNDQTDASVRQTEASITAVSAQLEQSRAALWRDQQTYQRTQGLYDAKVASAQDRDLADAAVRTSQAAVKSLEEQVKAQEALRSVAQANRKQLDIQQMDLAGAQAQLQQARAEVEGAVTRLGYTKVYSPLDGIVSVRAARQGEMIAAGSPIVTIIDVDHLWVQTGVEESLVNSIQFDQSLRVRLPSGEEIQGKVFFKGVESEFATQRDVSRTKRDIKTFEIRLRVDNADRRLAVGMTAYVLLPLL